MQQVADESGNLSGYEGTAQALPIWLIFS